MGGLASLSQGRNDTWDVPAELSSPISVHNMRSNAYNGGAYLIASIQLKYLETNCFQFVENLNITTETLEAMLRSKILTTYNKDTNFINRVAYVCLKIETTYAEIINYLDNNLMCNKRSLEEITESYFGVKYKLDWIWSEIQGNVSIEQQDLLVSSQFISKRPIISRIPPGAEFFFGSRCGNCGGFSWRRFN